MAETRPLSVLMVSAGFHPAVGGAEKQALELAVALRARGLAVRVATRRLSGLRAVDEVRCVAVSRLWCAGEGLFNAATFMLSLFAFLLVHAASYDVIHVHLAGSPALAAALAGRLLRKRVLIKLGGGKGIGELAASSRKASGRLKLAALRALKPRFVAVARELAEEARAYLGCVPVRVLANGVDTRAYRPAEPARKAELRAKLGWLAGAPVFLYVGRLSPEKRLPAFLEAWLDEVRKAGVRAHAAFVGDGVEAGPLRGVISRARACDRAVLCPTTAEVADYYAAADVFVLPSVSEGLSNALLEAMASGLAILASRVGGTPEAVDEGVSGLLFDPRDPEDLRRQLRKLLEHPELAAKMGAAARQAAVSRYSLERLAEAYEALYRDERLQGLE